MEKSVTITISGACFWALIPFKRYQNTSGCATAICVIFKIQLLVKISFPHIFKLDSTSQFEEASKLVH